MNEKVIKSSYIIGSFKVKTRLVGFNGLHIISNFVYLKYYFPAVEYLNLRHLCQKELVLFLYLSSSIPYNTKLMKYVRNIYKLTYNNIKNNNLPLL